MSAFGSVWLNIVEFEAKGGLRKFASGVALYAVIFTLPLLALWFLYWGDEIDVLIWGIDL